MNIKEQIDNDIIRTQLFCLGGRGNAYLVADIPICKAYTAASKAPFTAITA